ncbi:MAG: HNH endonuclease [Leptospiraceae bacterium]|nr:HNH endonuclease [Leptospiraceae bacterium]
MNQESLFLGVSDEEIQKQRRIAKELKSTSWWKKKKSQGICHYCRNKFLPEELTMDHLIPLSKGGKSIRANLVPSCKSCNSKKKNALPFEFT